MPIIAASDGTFMGFVEVTYSAVTGAATYRVFRSTVDNFNTAELIGETSELTFNDFTAQPNVQYYYWVVAQGPESISDPGFAIPENYVGPTIVDSTTVSNHHKVNSSSSVTVNNFSAVRADDMLVAVVHATGISPNSVSSISVPAGWVAVRSVVSTNDFTYMRQVIAYKIAGSDEPSTYSFGTTDASFDAVGPRYTVNMHLVRGHDLAAPVPTSSIRNDTIRTIRPIPAVTSTRNNSLAIAASTLAVDFDDYATFERVWTGSVELLKENHKNSGGIHEFSTMVHYLEMPVAGSSGEPNFEMRTATQGIGSINRRHAGIMILIQPPVLEA